MVQHMDFQFDQYIIVLHCCSIRVLYIVTVQYNVIFSQGEAIARNVHLKMYSPLLGKKSKSNILLYSAIFEYSQVHIRHMYNTITTN
jgi:hypothetical protein